MSLPTRSLFEAVRAACPPATWSRGVELVRANAVAGELVAADEAVFRVSTRGGMICPRVQLFPEEAEWDCDCGTRHSVCEHVAAAVIAWQRAQEEGRDPLAPSVLAGRVGYRFTRTRGGLALERVIVSGRGVQALEASLAAIASGRVDGPRFQATQADLAVELALGTHRRGLVAAPLATRIWPELSRSEDVQLDGRPVRVSVQPLVPRARVTEEGDGFRLRLEQDPEITERFANGIVLCGESLRLVGLINLTERERRDLVVGRHYGPEAVGELVGDVLPSLKRREIPLDIETDRLPQAIRDRPRARVDVERRGHTLSVIGTVVYGEPPRARVDAGRLVHLGGAVPLRDAPAERNEARQLERIGLSPGVRVDYEGPQGVAFRARLRSWGGQVHGKGLEAFDLAPPLEPRVEIGADRLDLRFECAVTGLAQDAASPRARAGADPSEVLRAWRSGASLVPLLEGGWAPLPASWLDRHGHRLADLLEARDAAGRVPRACRRDLLELCEALDRPAPAELAALRERAEAFESVPATALPEDLTATLRPYQKEGVDWLVFLREAGLGALLADDMGLGKTLQALCALRPPALVVAPTSVLHNWAEEIRRYRPALVASIYHGTRREIDAAADVTLTTYAILRLDAERLAEREWSTVVLDEAQNVKNPESQVAAAAYKLRGGFRVALTGTPVENRLEELWSQFHFTNPGLLGGRRGFIERYATPIAAGDARAAERLRSRIRPFVLRRMKSAVARDLPPRTEMVRRAELSPEEREVYQAIHLATRRDVVEKLEAGGSVIAVLEALLRLRQAACHRALVPGQTASGSSKLDVLLDMLDSVKAEGRKALVFSQWTSLLDLTEPHLAAAGIDYVRLDGSTRDRADVVERFQRPDGPPVMLISLKAGGTGLNLTAADHVFLLDPWWNPAVEDQAADRAHRIGQESPVMVYRLVASDTVEERILALQAKKRQIADAALAEGAGAGSLTRDDLLELLDLDGPT